MKKLVALLFVVVLLISMVGCSSKQVAATEQEVSSSQVVEVEPEISNVAEVNFTPERFNYITFESIPKYYEFVASNEDITVARNLSGFMTINYMVWVEETSGSNPNRIQFHYSFVDDGEKHGEYRLVLHGTGGVRTDVSEHLSFIRESANGHWDIYMLDFNFLTENMYVAPEKVFEIVMIPTDESILGTITLNGFYGYQRDNSNLQPTDKIYERLYNDTLVVADGISVSTLDRSAFDARVSK